jgi:hypothetical protein
MTLKNIIQNRLQQLENRKMMIPRYVERPGKFLGKKDFSLEDLPKIEAQIAECKAALKGINDFFNHQ